MTIYDDLRNVSEEIFAEFKNPVSIQLAKITSGTGAADNPGASSQVLHDLDATCTGIPFKYLKDGFALASDHLVSCAPLDGVTVSPKDFILIGGVKYKIVQDLSVPSSGAYVVWKFIVRKGG